MKGIAAYFVLVWLMALDLASRTLAAELVGATGGFHVLLPGIAIDYLVRPNAGLPIWPTIAVAIIALAVLIRLRSSARMVERLAGAALLAGGAANLLEIMLNGTVTTLLAVGPVSAPLLRLNFADVWIAGAVLLALGDALGRVGANPRLKGTETP
jgi:lipoprotein signal peptidase